MRKHSKFGRLLAYFRYMRDVTQVELAYHLENLRYPISISSISKYEFGNRSPSPEFVYHACKALELSEEEEQMLVNACVADITERFMTAYNALASQDSKGANNSSST